MTGRKKLVVGLPTAPISDEEIDRTRASRLVAGNRWPVNLVVYTRDGVRVVPLTEGRSVKIGREPPADVVIRDGSLSREHVALALLEGEVWVEDLDSTNGTRINNERIDRACLRPGDELIIGAVIASLQIIDPSSGSGRRPVMSHDRFREELDIEAARTRAFHRPLGLLAVMAVPVQQIHVRKWLPDVRALLRPFDRIALYSAGVVEVLLPEVSTTHLEGLVEKLTADGSLLCSFGLLPDHAASGEELIEVTLAALRRATPSAPVAVPEASGEPPVYRELGEPVIASKTMQAVFALARRVAVFTIPVLVVGETGTGKELVARVIHEASRRSGPMISVNCAALPSQLIESALFGHEKGAFTSAVRRGEGVFEAAHGGTVFLDEVGELSLQAQAALLRVLEVKRFSRVGSTTEVEVDVRIIAATHRDIKVMCTTGAFREDLLYRLNAVVIDIPPLRSRLEEIGVLSQRFIDDFRKAQGGDARSIDTAALDALLAYPWPGNVRELRNAIERAMVISESSAITLADLPESVQAMAGATWTSGPSQGSAGLTPSDVNAPRDMKRELDMIEREMIRAALDRADWNRPEAARLLGLPLRTLSDKIKKHKIRRQ